VKTERKLNELEYDLELDRVANEIKKQKAKKVLIQLPDGLKLYATQIVQEIKNKLKEKTQNKTEILIWMNSCYGACDVPLEAERIGVDMIIQFGHSAWDFSKKKSIKVVR